MLENKVRLWHFRATLSHYYEGKDPSFHFPVYDLPLRGEMPWQFLMQARGAFQAAPPTSACAACTQQPWVAVDSLC